MVCGLVKVKWEATLNNKPALPNWLRLLPSRHPEIAYLIGDRLVLLLTNQHTEYENHLVIFIAFYFRHSGYKCTACHPTCDSETTG